MIQKRRRKTRASLLEKKTAPVIVTEKIYEEVNSRSFDRNFNVLIQHYHRKELSNTATPLK